MAILSPPAVNLQGQPESLAATLQSELATASQFKTYLIIPEAVWSSLQPHLTARLEVMRSVTPLSAPKHWRDFKKLLAGTQERSVYLLLRSL